MTTPRRPAIGYIRAGSPEPDSLAVQHQRARLAAWAAETGHDLILVVEEYGTGHADRAFDRAVALCSGRLIVATAADRISRDLVVVKARAEQVRAAGGELVFVDDSNQQTPDATWEARLTSLIDAYETEERTARAATYRRRPSQGLDQAGPQQQAAAAWDALDTLDSEVVAVDGAGLGRDPHEIIDDEEL